MGFPKMTRGNIKRQFDQPGYPPIKISILAIAQLVKLEQGDNIIWIRAPFMDEFAYEINEVKRWSISRSRIRT